MCSGRMDTMPRHCTAGLDATGMDATGMKAAGMETTWMDAARMDAAWMDAAGMRHSMKAWRMIQMLGQRAMRGVECEPATWRLA